MSALNIMMSERPSTKELTVTGYTVRDLYLDGYLDGILAIKLVGDKKVEVYIGTDNGDLWFAPQAYVDDHHIGEAMTPVKAARMAEFRALMSHRHIQ